MDNKSIRKTVLHSLRAISSTRESAFYTNLFQQQDAARFALVVIDNRCLKNPLLDVLVSDLKILSELGLTPILVVGGMGDDLTNVRFQSARLCKALEKLSINSTKLNCASYDLLPDIKKIAAKGRIPVLEITEAARGENLQSLCMKLKPGKVIFVQPSGGIREAGRRRAVINIDKLETYPDASNLSVEQKQIIEIVTQISAKQSKNCTYVIVSPLNFLSELFTVKGAGTMLRRGARITAYSSYDDVKLGRLKTSIETAFDRELVDNYFAKAPLSVFLEENYRGGAILTQMAGLPYLSKFWVTHEAQGEGIARDIWQVLVDAKEAFFWRTRKDNPFNDWYMKMCDGMQVSGDWRVFWIGLQAPEIPSAINAAASATIDFKNNNNKAQ